MLILALLMQKLLRLCVVLLFAHKPSNAWLGLTRSCPKMKMNQNRRTHCLSPSTKSTAAATAAVTSDPNYPNSALLCCFAASCLLVSASGTCQFTRTPIQHPLHTKFTLLQKVPFCSTNTRRTRAPPAKYPLQTSARGNPDQEKRPQLGKLTVVF